jgi:hypothetical protein
MRRRGFLRFLLGAPLLPMADFAQVLEPPFDAANMTWPPLDLEGFLPPTEILIEIAPIDHAAIVRMLEEALADGYDPGDFLLDSDRNG